MSQKTDLVYSTQHGRMCPTCRRPIVECACSKEPATANRGPVRVRLETGGRRGKTVTVITGVPLASDALAELGRELKQKCGAGGTVRDGVIEIQGDHCEALVAELQRRGWKAKRIGK